jgi:hypothetical protein
MSDISDQAWSLRRKEMIYYPALINLHYHGITLGQSAAYGSYSVASAARRSSLIRVMVMRKPLAPTGCPIATAPPLTLVYHAVA